jgi:hypothetical protein
MDGLGIEPRASHMLSATPTALANPLLDDGYAGPIFSAALSSASIVATFSFRSRRFLASMSFLQYSLENHIDHM